MRLGLTVYIQNHADWDRHLAVEQGEDIPLEPNTDAIIWSEEIEAGIRAEEQGFDSIWTVEHHASPYTMVTNPLQALTFFAGATSKIDVGTMVVVVPWHHPLRLAEEITMLQHVLRGRKAFIGFGRGAGRREFKALGVDQNESRERFKEGVEIVKLALTQERFSYKSDTFDFADVVMRPRPRDGQQLIDDFCFSWGTPSSAEIGAGLGLRPMIIPQRAFAEYHDELANFAAARQQVGLGTANPKIHLHMICDADAGKAEEMAHKYIPEYVSSATLNYELGGSHFANIKGYEHYAATAGVTADMMAGAWIANCIWGTPDQCRQKIEALCEAFRPDEFMLTGRFGTMSNEVSMKSVDLFAREVLPAVQAMPVLEPLAAPALP
jgi:alkanesulfonate monooxygenase SsuD/methylene tetrahydromethanopterin reductase-like flavin-dependent oxidoreductase (luciferase family)